MILEINRTSNCIPTLKESENFDEMRQKFVALMDVIFTSANVQFWDKETDLYFEFAEKPQGKEPNSKPELIDLGQVWDKKPSIDEIKAAYFYALAVKIGSDMKVLETLLAKVFTSREDKVMPGNMANTYIKEFIYFLGDLDRAGKLV